MTMMVGCWASIVWTRMAVSGGIHHHMGCRLEFLKAAWPLPVCWVIFRAVFQIPPPTNKGNP